MNPILIALDVPFPKLQDFRGYVDPGLSSAFWRRVAG
jgi:hypothetical protein